MKKRIIAITIIMVMISALSPIMNNSFFYKFTVASATNDQLWRDEYHSILQNLPGFIDSVLGGIEQRESFVDMAFIYLYDLDYNGIPELHIQARYGATGAYGSSIIVLMDDSEMKIITHDSNNFNVPYISYFLPELYFNNSTGEYRWIHDFEDVSGFNKEQVQDHGIYAVECSISSNQLIFEVIAALPAVNGHYSRYAGDETIFIGEILSNHNESQIDEFIHKYNDYRNRWTLVPTSSEMIILQ